MDEFETDENIDSIEIEENSSKGFAGIVKKIKDMSKTYRTILIVVMSILLFDILFGIGFVCVKKASAIKLLNTGNGTTSEFIFLDSNARNGGLKKDGFANFKFSKSQLKLIQNFYEINKNAAFVIRVELKPTNNQEAFYNLPPQQVFKYGFLEDEDFSSYGKFIPIGKYDNKKINVFADLKKLNKKDITTFDLSLAISKDKVEKNQLPKGFFIYSDVKCKIKSVCIAPATLGFDLSSEVPFFGFSSNGGVVDVSFSSVDFSNAGETFYLRNSKNNILPEIVINLSDKEELQSTLENSVFVKLNVGGEQIFIKNVDKAKQIIIPSGALKSPYVLVDLAENKECIEGIFMESPKLSSEIKLNFTDAETYMPIKTDPGLILKYKVENWRNPDFEVFEWDRFSGILFFDTRNYDVQAKFFSRMAYFVEKEGFKGRILTNEELNGKHGYNAHDYSAESMANFFNAADAKGITLNKEEEILRRILLQNGLLIQEEGKLVAGNGGLVSISRESADYLRTQLLAHEGWHTIFFADEDFRNFVAAVYYTLDSKTRDFLIDYFKSQTALGYDTNDDYLMNNEFMAYIMQQGVNSVVNYWVTHAKWNSVQTYTKELADYIIKTNARGFEDAAIMLNDFVFDKYGIICGNIALVRQ